jgi:hypothetical protein
MKKIRTIYKALIVLFLINACTDERSLDFIESATAPENVSALYSIAQDNSGLVKITPTADGATSFDIYFGDTTEDPVNVENGTYLQHTYAEGIYEIKLLAYNLKGDITEATQELIVSFQAPKNLMVTLENDAAISKRVNISATAEYAASYDFYSGEDGVTQPVLTANNGDAISYQYADAGTYAVKVVAKGGAIETTEYTVDFEVTAILAPTASSVKPPSRNSADVISVFSDEYTDVAGTDFYPDWNQSTQYSVFDFSDEDAMLQYSNLNYQGIVIGATQDVSAMEFLHLDVWTSDATEIETFLISVSSGEKAIKTTLKKDNWTSITIPMSTFTDQGLTISDIHEIKLVGAGTVFIDNIYFYKSPSAVGTPIVFDGFEGNGNIATWAGDDCGMNASLANPFKNALNSSDTVLEYNDTGGQYANVRFDRAPNFDLTDGNSTFKLKIYVPSSSVSGSQTNQISLKLQDGTASEPWALQSEIIKQISLDSWQEVTFDFANDAIGGQQNPLDRTDFNRVVLQVNSENNNDAVIAYIDDLSYGNAVSADTAPFVEDGFEGAGTITTWAEDDCGMNTTFSNPYIDALNGSATVLEYNDTGGQYANIRFDVAPNFDLTAKSKFTLKIYVPSSSVSGSQTNQISLKLQDGTASEPWALQSEIIKSIALDTWQEVTFDFENDTIGGQQDPLDRTDFSRVVLQVNSENNNDAVIAYIDDFNYFK